MGADTGEATDYSRELDLDTAITTTRYRIGAVMYTREAFVSAPDQLLVLHISADVPGSVSLTARFDSQLRHTIRTRGTHFLQMTGVAPIHTAPNYVNDGNPVEYGDGGIMFAALLRAGTEGEIVHASDDGLTIAHAHAVTLYLSLTTSFVDAGNPIGRDPVAAAQAYLPAALPFSYDELRTRHIADHQALFRRVTLDLGENKAEAGLPTGERIRRFHESQDPRARRAFVSLWAVSVDNVKPPRNAARQPARHLERRTAPAVE